MAKSKEKYSAAELAALILETQGSIRELLKSEDAALLSKADDDSKGDEPKEESAPPEASSAPAEESAPAEAPAPAPEASAAPPAASASPEAPAAPPGDAAPMDPAQASGQPAAAAPGFVEALKAAYAQLAEQEGGDEVLKSHWMALKEVIAARMAASAPPAAPGADPMAASPAPAAPAGADPMAASAPAAPAPASPPMVSSAPVPPPDMAMKSEKALLEKLAKSEAQIAELQKTMESVQRGFEVFTRKPVQTAIRGKDLTTLAKSEESPKVNVSELSKTELHKKLGEITKNPDMRKSERQLVNSYFAGTVKAEALQVLFEKK
jgi:hypothetical protein